MRTSFASILCFLAASVLGAVGQYLYKSAADRAESGLFSYLVNVQLWGGVACYVAVMVLFVAAFKLGGRPSVLYPIYATTFIWSALIAWWWLGVPIKPVHVAGMFCLVGGMFLMGQ